MLRSTLRLNFCYLNFIQILHPRYHPKIIRHILKNKQKIKCVCIHEIIGLITIKMKINMKNRSPRYDLNRPRPRHGHNYSKCKCLSMSMFLVIKQRLSNINSWKSEATGKLSWKKLLLIKKCVLLKQSANIWVQFWNFDEVQCFNLSFVCEGVFYQMFLIKVVN